MGLTEKTELAISIVVHCGEDSAEILVKDNGPGFDPALLERLNARSDPSDLSGLILPDSGERHIGIENVKRRLYHIYKGHAYLKFLMMSRRAALLF